MLTYETKMRLWKGMGILVIVALLVSMYEPKKKKKEPRWEEWT